MASLYNPLVTKSKMISLCEACMIFYIFLFIPYVQFGVFANQLPISDGGLVDPWRGKWFPQPPGKTVDDNPKVEYGISRSDLHDSRHGIVMGIKSSHCDDAKTNLTLDWDNSPLNYTCFEERRLYTPRVDVNPVLYCDHIPPAYVALHECMDTPISYEQDIPTFGTHRPLWPKYGEYRFVPRQRWVHNLEHGAVVMLYHPCANKYEVNLLRKLVGDCLYRHIITPSTFLDEERPLAVVTWGCRLLMSKVDPKIVVNFIQSAALRGPEMVSRDGQYDHELLFPAKVVSDRNDNNLCPNF